MIPYDTRIQPPAPFVDVTVQNPYSRIDPVVMRAILDTGADITAIPHQAVEALGLKSAKTISMFGIGGEIGTVPTFLISIELVGNSIDAFYAIEWGGDFVVLGRDVLNEFYIILDGQMKQFELKAM